MRTVNWLGCIFAVGLGGCSFYPVPDDVSPYRTEDIVRFGRCEVKDALLRDLERRQIITDQTKPAKIRSTIEALKKTKRTLSPQELHLLRLTKVAIVYSYDFNITETNHAGAVAGFRLPWAANTLDVGGGGALDLTRVGWRVFGAEDSWDDLITNTTLCSRLSGQPRPENFIYPITGSLGVDPDPLIGSIGVGRVVETFIDIDEQGGAKDNFVDTLTFTTNAVGGANATVQLDPVPNQFRPVSGSASISASRVDVHKLTISLAFPTQDPPAAPDAISGVKRAEGDLNAPFERPPVWRARYNLCVQDARTREASFKQLRLTDPLVYCIAYADEFAPKYGRVGEQTVATTTTITTTTTAAPKSAPSKGEASPSAKGAAAPAGAAAAPSEVTVKETVAPSVTTTIVPRVRPNLRPYFQ